MSSSKGKSKGVPEEVLKLLVAADERHGFPAGTMASVMQQEIGGNFDKYLADPAAYHYEAGPDGRRVAGHTGKVSTAFGPFGILESTGADPGYGVKPLQGKGLDEQVRFASDYLAARTKGAGSLVDGLAGYGEGSKYAQQVVGRLGAGGQGQGSKASPSPVVAAEIVPTQLPAVVAPPADQAVAPQVVSWGGAGEGDAWQTFLRSMPKARAPEQVAALRSYGQTTPALNQAPQFRAPPVQSLRPNFEAFGSWGRAA